MTQRLTGICGLPGAVIRWRQTWSEETQVSRFKAVFVVLLGLAVLLGGCSHTPADPNDPDDLFREAEEYLEDERFLIAIEKYRDIKNRFPYSPRATDSELRIADTFFEQESFLESASAYEVFRELHPTHPKSDYVQYRVALSYFRQIPENPARDLSAAHRAIAEFNKLQNKFPRSDYLSKSQELLRQARIKLAEYERYVADFYFRRKHYLSASYRYAALLQQFSNLGYDEEALFRLGESYYRIKVFGEAEKTLNTLINRFPESKYKARSLALLSELKKKQN